MFWTDGEPIHPRRVEPSIFKLSGNVSSDCDRANVLSAQLELVGLQMKQLDALHAAAIKQAKEAGRLVGEARKPENTERQDEILDEAEKAIGEAVAKWEEARSKTGALGAASENLADLVGKGVEKFRETQAALKRMFASVKVAAAELRKESKGANS
jgi:hypothetical protein